MSKTDQLRKLPSVDEVLRSEKVAQLHHLHSSCQITQWVREAVQDCRSQILDGTAVDAGSAMDMVVESVKRRQANDSGQCIQRVINATGIMLHTNLGRAPLAALAVERMIEAAGYANVESNLRTGRRSKRGERVTRLLAQLAGAEDALVVNNCAAATILVLQAIAAGREVIVSRGQLVEIGGGFRLPDVFRSAGVVLREVGTTNRTYLRDYESAVGERTGAIIRVHHSNFRITGFVTEPSIDELVTVERPSEVPVIDDLGSGCMEDLSSLGLSEPTVGASVAAGADLTLFSGDKLFGGPQCGMIVGRSRWIECLRESPMMRTLRVDKITLAALEATTEIHLSGNAMAELPVLKMLAEDENEIRRRCEQLRDRICDLCDAEVIACESHVGGGSVPGRPMASFGIKISGGNPDTLAARLRTGSTAVQTRVANDSLLMDLRTVAEDELDQLVSRLRESLERNDSGDADV